MANNYVHFSTTLDVKTSENVKKIFEEYKRQKDEWDKYDDSEPLSFLISKNNPNEGCLEIYDDAGCGDPDKVIKFLQPILPQMNLSGYWGLQYACVSDKPKVDEFSGGAIILDLLNGQIVDHVDTVGWVEKTIYHLLNPDPSEV